MSDLDWDFRGGGNALDTSAAAQQATLLLRQLAGSSTAVQEQLAAGVRSAPAQLPAAASTPAVPTANGVTPWRSAPAGPSPNSLRPGLAR